MNNTPRFKWSVFRKEFVDSAIIRPIVYYLSLNALFEMNVFIYKGLGWIDEGHFVPELLLCALLDFVASIAIALALTTGIFNSSLSLKRRAAIEFLLPVLFFIGFSIAGKSFKAYPILICSGYFIAVNHSQIWLKGRISKALSSPPASASN